MMAGTMALMSFGFRKMALNFCAMQFVTICDSACVSPLASKVNMSKPNCEPNLRNCFAEKAWDGLAAFEMTNAALTSLAWAPTPKAIATSRMSPMTKTLFIPYLPPDSYWMKHKNVSSVNLDDYT